MSRNYGLGSRDMKQAGYKALERGMQSFASIATISDRWSQFVDWAKEEHGIGRMERVTREMVQEYGEKLAEKVEAGAMSPATAQNYVSAVNRVMELARGDKETWVSPTKDCAIPERSGIATANKAVDEVSHRVAMAAVDARTGVLLELQRNLGLRFEESAKINARAVLEEAKERNAVSITDGTKGGREREIPITSPAQISVLARAAEIQGGARSMIPADQSYKEFRAECYRTAGEQNIHYHGERHAYAHARYQELVGAKCPVEAGIKHGKAHHEWLARQLKVSVAEAKAQDVKARTQIAAELGHGRIGISNAYLG